MTRGAHANDKSFHYTCGFRFRKCAEECSELAAELLKCVNKCNLQPGDTEFQRRCKKIFSEMNDVRKQLILIEEIINTT
jgi:hypothetical protein